MPSPKTKKDTIALRLIKSEAMVRMQKELNGNQQTLIRMLQQQNSHLELNLKVLRIDHDFLISKCQWLEKLIALYTTPSWEQ